MKKMQDDVYKEMEEVVKREKVDWLRKDCYIYVWVSDRKGRTKNRVEKIDNHKEKVQRK